MFVANEKGLGSGTTRGKCHNMRVDLGIDECTIHVYLFITLNHWLGILVANIDFLWCSITVMRAMPIRRLAAHMLLMIVTEVRSIRTCILSRK